MMRSFARRLWVWAAVASLAPAVFGQNQGNLPPSIEIVRWAVVRDGSTIVVYDRDAGIGSIEAISNFIHQEVDEVRATVEVTDPDWTVDENGAVDEDPVFLRFVARGDILLAPPDPTPIPEATGTFFGSGGQNDGFQPATAPPLIQYTFSFTVPQFLGRNQRRLRGQINYDVAWRIEFDASNDEGTNQTEEIVMDSVFVTLKAVENPALGPSNAPPFADAGADRTVPVGLDVILDGRRTFDAFNVGFDADDTNVFEKDTLTFAWEWVSGPVRVDPVQTGPHSPVATVRFEVPNDPNDPNDAYVYRLTVDDNVNALPSTDTVRLRVVESLPQEHPPRAVIVGPANPVPVGSVVTLCGRRSCDLDCDPNCGGALTTDPCVDDTAVMPCDGWLHYRWLQTNELGQPLEQDQVPRVFQPLSGLDQPSITWQALVPGTYYFRLLVDDGDFQATTTFSVTVVDTQTQGETIGDAGSGDQAVSDSGNPPDSGLGFVPTAPALCGAGLLPVAVVPVALIALRRRYH